MENKDQNPLNPTGGLETDSYNIGNVHEAPADVNSLSAVPEGVVLDTQAKRSGSQANRFLRFARRLDVLLVTLLLVGGVGTYFTLTQVHSNKSIATSGANSFSDIKIPLEQLVSGKDLSIAGASNVTINGQLLLNEPFLLAPSVQPVGAIAGEIYFDKDTDQLAYYNGSTFVFLTGTPASGIQSLSGNVQSIGGVNGQITLGNGLSMTASQLSNSGVLSVQGQTGAVTLTAGPGIVINGTNFSNSGVLSVASGSPNLSVASDGKGNVTLTVAAGGTGTVTSSGGTSGALPLFTGSQNIENSIVTQSGLTVTISGDLSVVTGGLSLSNALTVSNGGTGATSFAANGVLVGNGTAAVNSVAAGGSGLCLLSTVGLPTWAACPSGSGVTSLNSLTGALNIANASAAGTTITIDNASTLTKGIASFNGTNFTATSGAINTVQDINSSATPTFAGVNTNNITPSAALTVGISAQTALLQGSTTTIKSNGIGNNIVLNSAGTIELQSPTNVTGNLATSGSLAVNGGSITSSGALSITPTGALTLGSSSQAISLQGGPTSSFTVTSGANATVVGFTSPTANTTLNFPALVAGTYTICTTSGNCAGAGVTLQAAYSNSSTPEITLDATRGALTIRDNSTPIGANLLEVQNNAGTTTYLAVTSSGATVTGTATVSGNINTTGGALQTNGTTRVDNTGNLINIASVTATGNATFQGGSATLGTATQAGSLVLSDGSTNTGTLQVAALGQNTTYTLPDPGSTTATICLTTGNCAGTGGGVTTPGGTTNAIPKFTGAQTLGNSSISDNGVTVTTTENLVIQGGSTTLGVAGVQGGSMILASATGAFTGSVATTALTANQNYTLPNATGTFCLTSGNCAGVGGTGDVLQGGNNFGTALTLGTNDNFGFNFETNGITRMTLANDGSQLLLSSNMNLVLQGANAHITNTQGQTSSEAFGQGAAVSGSNAVAVGNGAKAPAHGTSVGNAAGATAGLFGGPVSLGDSANAASWGVAVGQNSSTTANDGVAVGNGATAAQDAIALGMNSSAALNGIALGFGATTGGNNRIVIGHNAVATADNQLVIGSSDSFISDGYIGNGVANTTPQNFTLHATGGSGTNVTGANLNLAAGAGTGSANGGNLNFQVATPGLAGASANVPATVFSLSGATGAALFKNLVNSATGFQVQNAGGAAAFTVDTTTSNATVGGNLALNGGTLSSTGALNITPAGTLTVGVVGQQLILQGNANTTLSATGSGFTTTVGFSGVPTGNVNYNFDRSATAGTYTICTSIGNCASSGGGVTTAGGTTGTLPVFTGSQTIGNSLLSQSGSTVTVNGNLNLVTGNTFQVNGTQISSANLSNDANLAKLSASQTFTGNTVAFVNGTNSTNAFNIQNALGNRIMTADTTNGQVVLGTSSSLAGKLVFNNVSNAFAVTMVSAALTASRTLTLPDASGIICTDSGNCAGAGATLQTGYNFSVGGTTPKIKVNSTLLGVDIQDADTTIAADLFDIRGSNSLGLGSVMFGVSSTGKATLQNLSNSTTAFRLLTSGGTAVLTGDTTNGQALLGQSGTLNGTLVFNNSTNSNTVTLTAPVATANQSITLPNASGTICLNSGNCSGAGSSNTLQAAYDAGNTITTSDGRDVSFTLADTTTDSNLLVNLQCVTGCGSNGRFAVQNSGTDVFTISPNGGAAKFQPSTNSANAFQIKNATGSGVFDADTTNKRIGINNGAPAYPLDVNGDTNISSGSSYRINGTAICTGSGCTAASGSGFYIQNTTSTQAANFNVQAATSGSVAAVLQANAAGSGDIMDLKNGSGTAVATFSSIGSVLFKNSFDSTSAFQVQSAASATPLLNVDTTNGRVGIGGVASFSKFEVLGGDAAIYNSGGNPRLVLGNSTAAGQNGYLQWDSTNNYFRIETAGTNGLKINDNFVTIGNIFPSQPLIVANGTTQLFQINTTGSVLAKTSTNSTTAFQVQNASATTLLNVDTTNNQVTVTGDLLGTGIQPASLATNGTNGTFDSLTSAAGGNTTGTTGQTAGNGGNFFVSAGNGGNAPSGSANGWGGNVFISGGAAGTGTGSAGFHGNVILQGSGGAVGIGTLSPNIAYKLDAAGDINVSSGSSYRINGVAICTSSGCTPSSGSGFYIQNTTSTQAANFDVQAATSGSVAAVLQANAVGSGDILNLRDGSNNNVATFSSTGVVTLQNSVDGYQAFRILNHAGNASVVVSTMSGQLTLGNITSVSGAGVTGSLTIADGTNDNFSMTLNTATVTGYRTITLPDANGTVCLQGSAGCGFIQNQNAAQQASSNFWISGTGRADTALQAPVIDTPSGTLTLQLGTTNASSIELMHSSFFANGTNRSLYVQQAASGNDGSSLTIYAGAGNGTNKNGGNLILQGGNSTGTGTAGSVIVRPQTDVSTAFQVLSVSGNNIFNVDTTNSGKATLFGLIPGEINPWSTATNTLPSGRYGGMGVTANGYMYQLGGNDSTNNSRDTIYYTKVNADGSVGAWTTSATTLPTQRARAGATVVNGYVYIVGGINTSSTAFATVFYAKLNSDGSVGTWQTAANSIPAGRQSGSMTSANGYLYFVGGQDTAGTTHNDVYYAKVNADGSVGAWTTSANPVTTERNFEATIVNNGYLYVIGGQDNTGVQTSTVYYSKLSATDGSNGTWSTTTALPAIRAEEQAFVANGNMYLIGGNSAGYIASVLFAHINNDGTIGSWTTSANSLPAVRASANGAMVNGYMYNIAGWGGLAANTVYYTSAARVQIGASLDLVGLQGQNLTDGGNDPASGSGGGSITAGNGRFIGGLDVIGQANFSNGVTVNGIFTANDAAAFQDKTNTSGAFQVLNASGVPLFSIDTSSSRVYIGNPAGDTTGALLVLDSKTGSSADPTGINGAMYYNATDNAFRCYENGAWRYCMNSGRLVYNYQTDMIGTASDNNASYYTSNAGSFSGSAVAGTQGHPGIVQLSTGINTNGQGAIGANDTGSSFLFGGGTTWMYDTEVNIPTLSDATNTFAVRAGYYDGGGADGTDGCLLKYSSATNGGKWQGICENNTTQSTCDTTIAAVANTWYRLTININSTASAAVFSVTSGGTTTSCTVSSNIPSTTGRETSWNESIVKSAGTTARTLNMDYIEVRGEFIGGR